MAQVIVHTNAAPEAIGPYSQGIVSESMLFVSGQLGLDPKTGEMSGLDFECQVRQALKNLHEVILAGGFALSQVVAVDVFMTDLSLFKAFNEIYANFFSGHRPARAVVQVAALPKNALIEIKCIAQK